MKAFPWIKHQDPLQGVRDFNLSNAFRTTLMCAKAAEKDFGCPGAGGISEIPIPCVSKGDRRDAMPVGGPGQPVPGSLAARGVG